MKTRNFASFSNSRASASFSNSIEKGQACLTNHRSRYLMGMLIKHNSGFSLFEMIMVVAMVVAMVAIVMVLIIPDGIVKTGLKAKIQSEQQNLTMIEAAKHHWTADKPAKQNLLSKEVKRLSPEKLVKVPGGTLRFSPDKEGIFGFSDVKGLVSPQGEIPALRFFVRSTKFGSYAWTVDFGNGSLLETQVYSDGDTLRGASVVHGKNGYTDAYTWTAKRKSGPSFDMLV